MAGLRQEIQAKKLTYTVGYTTAMDRSLEELTGATPPGDLPGAAGRQNEMAAKMLRIDLEARDQYQKANPRYKFPELQIACNANLPAFDWRSRGKVTPVKNQGACGSCWAFAALGAYEGSYAIRNNALIDASEQDVVSCAGAGNCNGGWWGGALEWLVNHGTATEAAYPYTASNSACNTGAGTPYRAVAWGYVGSGTGIPSVNQLKQALCQYGPLAVGIHCSYALQAYTSGVLNEHENLPVNGGITMIGWDDSKHAWLVKNQWGTGWGMAGYGWIDYNSNSIGWGAAWVQARNRWYILPHQYFELQPNIKPFPDPEKP